jgi:hypothetical protein
MVEASRFSFACLRTRNALFRAATFMKGSAWLRVHGLVYAIGTSLVLKSMLQQMVLAVLS